jgi:type I restriction enzyme S subunit
VSGKHDEALVNEPCVVIGRKGTIGSTHFCPDPVWPIDTTFFVTGSDDIDIRFAYYLLQTLPFKTMNNDSAVPGLNRTQAESIVVSIPTLHEQQAISETLGALDDKIESNLRVIDTAEELCRAYFAAATKTSVVASSVLKPILGGTPKRDVTSYWGGKIQWASAKDVAGSSGGFVINTSETITEDGLQNSAAKLLPAGTTVMTARGTVGALARLGMPMAFNQSCYGLLALNGEPLTLFFALENAVGRIRDAGHGTVFNTVNMATFDQITLEMTTQGAIEEELTRLSDLVKSRLIENLKLSELRDALLPELLAGRIKVGEVAA